MIGRPETRVDFAGHFGDERLILVDERGAPVGWEREVCTVYIGRAGAPGEGDPRELSALCYRPASELDALLEDDASPYTLWFRIAWRRLRTEHWERVVALPEANV